jgi:hypothetical protein
MEQQGVRRPTPAPLRSAYRVTDSNNLALVRDTAEKWHFVFGLVGLTELGRLLVFAHVTSSSESFRATC